MSSSYINYTCVKTNNLKGVDFVVKRGDVIVLSGPSGSGKSSLAIDTIYKISENELFQLMNRRDCTSNYIIKEFSGIIPTICLEQENFNTNPRSTIATYFNVDIFFQDIFASINHVSPVLFQFNRLGSACPKCLGVGTILFPDVFKLVDVFAPLSSKSFRRWRNIDADFYRQIFDVFCKEAGINYKGKTFAELSPKEQDLLLYGVSPDKKFIKFTSNGKTRQRTAKFTGAIRELLVKQENGICNISDKKYYIEQQCPVCNGGRFSEQVKQYTVNGKSLDMLYSMSIDELHSWLLDWKTNEKGNMLSPAVDAIVRFFESVRSLRIGYLNLNRSIPSLSGGELQRLRLAKAANSHFTNMFYVLDEPTSSIHPSEWGMISLLIEKIKSNSNTILIIDHSLAFNNIANKTYHIGPGAGQYGGQIVKAPNVEDIKIKPTFFVGHFFSLTNEITFNNVIIKNARVPLATLVGICGVSGSGKTSFGKGILPRYIPDAVFLNQEPIHGNAYSIVATALGIMPEIQDLFAKSNHLASIDFSFSSASKGQCIACGGYGKKIEGSSFSQTSFVCPSCQGKRFSEKILKYTFSGCNIHEFLSLELTDAIQVIPKKTKLHRVIDGAISCGLGYLNLFQETDTVSGGEAQRIKLANALFKGSTAKVFVLDEPFRGVDESNVARIVSLFYQLLKNGYSFFVIEHDLVALSYCSYLIEFGPGSGANGGEIIYNGETTKIVDSGLSIIAPFLQSKGIGFFTQRK